MNNGLTVLQVAQRLNMHTDDIKRWIRTEQCPVIRDGRKVRIPSDWVEQIVQRQAAK